MNGIHHSLLLLFLLVASPLVSGQQTDLQSQLSRAEATWRKQQLHRYEFTVRVWCFCGLAGSPMRFRVEEGTSTPIDVPIGLVRVAKRNGVTSIEELFSILHRYAAGNPDKLIIHFDSERGFPTEVDMDSKRDWTDDELLIRITDFKIL